MREFTEKGPRIAKTGLWMGQNAADMSADVVTDFPRGLPDGDIRKPVGTARWISSSGACGLLGEWKPGRFLIGRDSAGRYVGHDDDRHILTVAASRAGKGDSLICQICYQSRQPASKQGRLPTQNSKRAIRRNVFQRNFDCYTLVHAGWRNLLTCLPTIIGIY
jgi:hypothetical protein